MLLLFFVVVINYFDCSLLLVVNLMICEELGLSVIEIGVLFFVFLFVYGIV